MVNFWTEIRWGLACLAILMAVALGACPTDDDDDSAVGDDDTGAGDDDTGDDDAADPVVLHGVWKDSNCEGAIPGVTVCYEMEHPWAESMCTETDGNGSFAFGGVPGDARGLMASEGGTPEVHPAIIPLVLEGENYFVEMCDFTLAELEAFHEDVGMIHDPTLGTAGFTVRKVNFGVLFAATGAEIHLEGGSTRGPYYASSNGHALDPEATAITGGAFGFFFGVEPGEYTFSATLDGHVCDQLEAGGESPLTEDVPAGWTVWASVVCTPE